MDGIKREEPKKERRFSQEQYDMLKRCSDKKDMTEWNEWRKENPDKDILLEGADLSGACIDGALLNGGGYKNAITKEYEKFEGEVHLENANLRRASLKNACLWGAFMQAAHLGYAHLEGADLFYAQLKNAYLMEAHLEDAKFLQANLEGAILSLSQLERAMLTGAHLEGADLTGANLKDAHLENAHLEGSNLRDANLQKAQIRNAHLEGADISEANLVGAKCQRAKVNGSTSFWECKVNRYCKNNEFTDFSGVALDDTSIDPGTKQLLEYNIRRKNWEEWYKKHYFWRWPILLFWLISNYGLSATRVMGIFFLLAMFFAAIYANFACWYPPGIVSDLTVEPHLPLWHYFLLLLLRPIYFSVVTMTTLGFGDMYANSQSILGHLLLTVQVILGYVLLGALVTRFAVLFTAGGPVGEFANEK